MFIEARKVNLSIASYFILIQVHKQQKAVSEGVRTPFKPVNVTTNDNSTFPSL